LNTNLGWQYAFGDINTISSHSLINSNSNSFDVRGVPLSKKSGIVDLGLTYLPTTNLYLSVIYLGEYSKETTEHSGMFRVNYRL
ncbi:MAG: autotransporter domain-containing protein, partial [Campylobacteraceae bacterium]